jgi:hypothetical protein
MRFSGINKQKISHIKCKIDSDSRFIKNTVIFLAVRTQLLQITTVRTAQNGLLSIQRDMDIDKLPMRFIFSGYRRSKLGIYQIHPEFRAIQFITARSSIFRKCGKKISKLFPDLRSQCGIPVKRPHTVTNHNQILL